MDSSPSPARHCQAASANTPPPSRHRTTPHGQLAVGITCCRQPKEELGERADGQSAERRWLLIFTSLATSTTAAKLWVEETGDGGRQDEWWGGGGSRGVSFSHHLPPPSLVSSVLNLGWWQKRCENGKPSPTCLLAQLSLWPPMMSCPSELAMWSCPAATWWQWIDRGDLAMVSWWRWAGHAELS